VGSTDRNPEFGGFVVDRCACGGAVYGGIDGPFGPCDLAPADWVRVTDEHGCERYRERTPITACCNCPWDAGSEPDGTDAG
jgi:hypothetical protein